MARQFSPPSRDPQRQSLSKWSHSSGGLLGKDVLFENQSTHSWRSVTCGTSWRGAMGTVGPEDLVDEGDACLRPPP